MSNTVEIAVAVCTHNPRADYLARTLDALRAQTLTVGRWELLIIDNGSVPPLSPDIAWHPRGRVVREEKPGLTPARLCAIEHMQSALLVLVDDDNVLAPDYLERCLEIAAEWPRLGTWGGQTPGEFEVEPEDWTRQYWPWLAVREFDRDSWSNALEENRTFPVGAGMCIRRDVAIAYKSLVTGDPIRQSLDRQGKRLVGGGDTDIAYTSLDCGFGNGLFARLKLTHLIPARRVSEEYLLELVESLTFSTLVLDALRGKPPAARSRSQRLLDAYERLHIAPRERRFADAVRRGKEAALREISSWKGAAK